MLISSTIQTVGILLRTFSKRGAVNPALLVGQRSAHRSNAYHFALCQPIVLASVFAVLTGCQSLQKYGNQDVDYGTGNAGSPQGEDYRILSEEATRELGVGPGKLAFVYAVSIAADGQTQIELFRIKDAVTQPLEFPLDSKVLLDVDPTAVIVFERPYGNTHICAGVVSGGGGSSVCPRH